MHQAFDNISARGTRRSSTQFNFLALSWTEPVLPGVPPNLSSVEAPTLSPRIGNTSKKIIQKDPCVYIWPRAPKWLAPLLHVDKQTCQQSKH